ncbi:helix-turn-helix transcriptional regulator [Aliarcobacter butzleri]|uniref:Helix-turn-helix transcriptional regulator n=1 Tax=Aliarcobacter butzleri TaxID=28197 RepID=A0AAW7PUW1_9BACT|nr:helix-turn-helix transcriptional regulator [Aliarcobacter butzleri]MDN5069418.1 helix-turn-helix transcriptional regulator [Aliarcobacter butzleri]
MNINSNFLSIRKCLGLTQDKFAEKLETSQNQISKYEKGQVDLPLSIIYNLNKVFKVNINWLVSNKGNMFIEDDISENYVVSQNGNGNLALNGKQIHININKDDVEILEYFKKLAPKKQEYYSHLIKADVLKEEIKKDNETEYR